MGLQEDLHPLEIHSLPVECQPTKDIVCKGHGNLEKKLGYDDHQDWQPLNNFYFVRFFYYLEKLCIPKNTHIPPELKPRTQYRYSEIIYASTNITHFWCESTRRGATREWF